MKINLGLKVLLASACLTLTGCMTGQDQDAETRAENTRKIKFVNAAVIAPVAQITAQGAPGQEFDPEAIKAQLQQLGCPRLVSLFDDLIKMDEDSDEIPASFKSAISCFKIGEGSNADSLQTNFKKDLANLAQCLCGGSGLDAFFEQNYELFSIQATAAAQTYNAATASAAAAFNANGSASGTGYSGNGSAAGTYTSK